MTAGRPQHSASTAPGRLGGAALAEAFAGGASALEQQADAINAINVFPVPDGDTGTNMSMTMQAAAGAALAAADGPPAAVAAAAADAALMGAKGNSGVILSQFLNGFARRLPSDDELAADDVAAAFERGRDAAYAVLSEPREGTILTACTAAAQEARRAVVSGEDVTAVITAAAQGAAKAADDSPKLLPILREAGVVDSGARGLHVMLEGMSRALRGEPVTLALQDGQIDASWLAATKRLHETEEAGYCTEFMLAAPSIDRSALRKSLADLGTSVLVVGGDGRVRVHVHTQQPEAALAFGRTLGAVSQEKAEDMSAQMAALAKRNGASARSAPAIAVVAVAAGDGIAALMRDLRVTEIVPGGQTMNPSAGEITAAIEGTGSSQVIVLPNNRNIVLAAEQAAKSVSAAVAVLPSTSIPAGLASLIAFNEERPFEANVADMQEALTHVTSGEVTTATRSATIDGITVREGEIIGLVDDVLRVAGDRIEDVLRETLRLCLGSGSYYATIYCGADADQELAANVAADISRGPDLEVRAVWGGQPHYPYLIGAER